MSLDRQTQLTALQQHCEACCRCELGSQRQQVVIGRGNPQARLLLIGEAPGADEDASGLPFVGRSGQLLDRLLHGAGLDPQRDLYICNAIKCRPPGNRKPKVTELAACRPWLAQQIALLDPALVLLLGATALEAVLGLKAPITRLRGQWLDAAQGPLAVELAGRQLMPLLHPSYLLRFATDREGSPRHLTRGDLQRVERRLAAVLAAPPGAPPS